MRKLRLAALGCIALVAAGCATTPPAPDIELPALRLAPAQLGATVSVTQRLDFRVTRGAREHAAGIDAVLEVDAASLRVAALALGRRVFSLQWDGVTLTEQRDPRMPASLSAERILRDIQFAYWPIAAVQAALPSGWRVDASQDTRTLTHVTATPLLRARYATSAIWAGRVTIDNLVEGYELVIDSQVQR